MIINECKVKTYDDESLSLKMIDTIKVRSYSEDSKMVVLKVEDKKMIVFADDLITAVKNCTNINK